MENQERKDLKEMEQKTFQIFKKEDNSCAIQVGDDIVTMDDIERVRLYQVINAVVEKPYIVPNNMLGCLLMYDNGIIATSFSIGKLDIAGQKFLVVVYTMNPRTSSYEINQFLLLRSAVDAYLEALK